MTETQETKQNSANDHDQDETVLRRRLGLKLLRRLLVYHASLAVVLMLIAVLFPAFLAKLPIGGVGLLEERGDIAVMTTAERPAAAGKNEVVGSLMDATSQFDRLGYARKLLIVLIGVWLLMLPIAWVHKGVHRGSAHDHSLDETTLILPGVVASIVLVVQHSLPLAFSLAGIVAGVQFRRALQDTFDALFILVAIGVGIAAGVAALEIAAVLSVFFAYATLYICFYGDGLESHYITRQKERKKQRKKDAASEQSEEPSSD